MARELAERRHARKHVEAGPTWPWIVGCVQVDPKASRPPPFEVLRGYGATIQRDVAPLRTHRIREKEFDSGRLGNEADLHATADQKLLEWGVDGDREERQGQKRRADRHRETDPGQNSGGPVGFLPPFDKLSRYRSNQRAAGTYSQRTC